MSPRPADAGGRKVILLGGSSEIALAIVRELQHSAPREVALLGRDRQALARAGDELRAAGCERVVEAELDANDTAGHARVLEDAFARLGGGDIVILAVGVLGDRGGFSDDLDGAVEVLRVNLLGAGSLLMAAAQRMRAARAGTLVVLSSVAAQRPRRANAVYGASKAGLDALAQGLADALHEDGVRVLVVRPGFVHTRMTAGLKSPPLSSTPQAVARAVVRGLGSRAHTVWVPPALRWVMMAIAIVPRSLFRRIPL